MIKGLEHLIYEKHMCLLAKDFLKNVNTRGEGEKVTEPGSFQWCPVTGPEAMSKN